MPSGPAINMGIAIDEQRKRRLEQALRQVSATDKRDKPRSAPLQKAG